MPGSAVRQSTCVALLVCLALVLAHGNVFSGPAPAPTGVVKLQVGTATIATPGAAPSPLARGDNVFPGQVIETGDRSFLRVEMSDGTRFTVGKNASASIDEFSFSDTNPQGRFAATVNFGGFAYASGSIGKLATRKHSFITTPTAVLGIRGSQANGNVDEATGETDVVVTAGVIDMNGNNIPVGGSGSSDATGSTTVSEVADEGVVANVNNSLPTKDEVKEAEVQQGVTSGDDANDDSKDDDDDKQDQDDNNQDNNNQDNNNQDDPNSVTTDDTPALGSQDNTITTERNNTPVGAAQL